MMQSTRLVLCGVLAWSCYGNESEPASASPLALYVPQIAVPPKAPNAPLESVPQVAIPSAPHVPQVPKMQPMQEKREVPFEGMPSTSVDQSQPGGLYVMAQPIAEEPVNPLSFIVGFAGGLAAGAALVYSLFKRIGQKVSVEAKGLELGARTFFDVESPSVTEAETPNPLVVQSKALAPYLAGGASLPAVIEQVTSGRTAMPAFGRPLGAINIGQGRRVVVNMMDTDIESAMKTEPDPDAAKFCYGLPGSSSPFVDWDPAGFLTNLDKLEVYRLRESELAHGRVGMLASLGFLVQEKWHPLVPEAGGPAINQIPQLPVWFWAVMIGGISAAEGRRIAVGWAYTRADDAGYEDFKDYRALREGYYPGDLGFDPLNLKPKDPAKFRAMQNKEINNGRLAMIAAAGFMAQEAVTGQTWGAYWVP